MTEEERVKEAEQLYKNNPKIRKAVQGLFKTLGKDKNLTGFGISYGGEEVVSLSREDIDRVNKNTKRGKTT